MDVKFTGDVVLAIAKAVRLERGSLYVPSGIAYQRPVWCNFEGAFERIEISPIQKILRVEADVEEGVGERKGHWEIMRQVALYHHGQKVAKVYLTGMKVDAGGGYWWAVDRISYLEELVVPRVNDRAVWHTIELDPTGRTFCGY